MLYAKYFLDQRWVIGSFDNEKNIPETGVILSEEELFMKDSFDYRMSTETGLFELIDKSPTELNIRKEAAMRLENLASGYQPQERETWHEQTREAEGYLSDPAYPTPFLSKRATARGITVQELATTVITKRNLYLEATATVLSAQDLLLAMNPTPEDYQDDKYWV